MTPQTPKRIPIAKRLAELNKKKPVVDQPHPTDTPTVFDPLADLSQGFGGQIAPALTVTQDGRLAAVSSRASIDTSNLSWEDAELIDPAVGADHHILVVGSDVDPRELEALAVSTWEDAGWIEAGVLRLTGEATLSGPFRIDTAVRQQLKTPADQEQAWVIEVEQCRTAPAPDFLLETDLIAQAFPDGMPAGPEYEIIQAMQRFARRLAGSIRVAETGRLIEPDADSAVAITVYASRWVDESDLSTLLRPYFPDITNAQNADELPPIDSPQERVQTREDLALAIDIPEDELERIAEITRVADEKALSEDFVVRGYSLLASAGNKSRVHITVAPSEYIPTALRYEQWPEGTAIEYGIQWVPPQVYLNALTRPGRAARLERIRVKDQIEQIATLISRSTAGHMLDEDQFLIAAQ
ncbi:MAG: PRTRC system protein E [Actinomycetaceae bacterium]|nr:PRTRC system protein E [Actinomycetaceae bacterium]